MSREEHKMEGGIKENLEVSGESNSGGRHTMQLRPRTVTDYRALNLGLTRKSERNKPKKKTQGYQSTSKTAKRSTEDSTTIKNGNEKIEPRLKKPRIGASDMKEANTKNITGESTDENEDYEEEMEEEREEDCDEEDNEENGSLDSENSSNDSYEADNSEEESHDSEDSNDEIEDAEDDDHNEEEVDCVDDEKSDSRGGGNGNDHYDYSAHDCEHDDDDDDLF